ncbi:MAG: zinc ribbon domain-containing protein [Calditrichaeota bacterium]|nr:MAG: zinc ribbon domain-containing protein [Calditrichota bacterium]
METKKHKGHFLHRFLIGFFSILLGFLIFWLLGFLLNDIENTPSISYQQVEEETIGKAKLGELERIQNQLREIAFSVQNQQQRQNILKQSTQNSQQTMNQLLELQKLNIQKGIKTTESERNSFLESQKIFLDNQKQFQDLNSEITKLNEKQQSLEQAQNEIQKELKNERKVIQKKYDSILSEHNFKLAGLKIAILLPFLLLALFFFLKKRDTIYVKMIYAFGIAVFAKFAFVMHDHFPTKYIKYILIVAAIGVVIRALIYLLKMLSKPKKDWLLKQYRESYEKFLCPTCDFPIRRGALKFLTKKGSKPLVKTEFENSAKDEPYNCPSCGENLYEECENCNKVRASLLPFCEHCGTNTNFRVSANV